MLQFWRFSSKKELVIHVSLAGTCNCNLFNTAHSSSSPSAILIQDGSVEQVSPVFAQCTQINRAQVVRTYSACILQSSKNLFCPKEKLKTKGPTWGRFGGFLLNHASFPPLGPFACSSLLPWLGFPLVYQVKELLPVWCTAWELVLQFCQL